MLGTHAEAHAESQDRLAVRGIPEQVTALPALHLRPEAAPGGFTVNQFLVDSDEPLLYHTGMRALFPAVRAAVETVMPLSRLRWIAFAHLEADECGAVNEFLAAAPHAQVGRGALGCPLSLDDQCLRPPHPMANGEVLHLGVRRPGQRPVTGIVVQQAGLEST